MGLGESKNVIVPALQGYGETDEDAYAEIPRTQFPAEIPLEPGTPLQLCDHEGQILDAIIDDIQDEVVRLNFNHPLAGKELHFHVRVVNLRDATEEEISHGHVHGNGYAESDEPDELDRE